nr:MAG TPA: hypothetical protein [Caudoviricetes sp.]
MINTSQKSILDQLLKMDLRVSLMSVLPRL